MSDSQLDKLLNRRTRLVDKHADYDRRLGLMKIGGRLGYCDFEMKQLKRWKLLCKDNMARIDARIAELNKPADSTESSAEHPATAPMKDLSFARAFDCTSPEDRAAGVPWGKMPSSKASAAA